MTKKNIKFTQTQAIELYEQRLTGTISDAEYQTVYVEKLYYFIVDCIGKSKILQGSYPKDYEYDDAISAGIIGMLNRLPYYDPHCSAPTTYLKPAIMTTLKDLKYGVRHGIKNHTRKAIDKLDSIAQKFGYEDCLDPSLDPVLLAVESKHKLNTILNLINLKRMSSGECSLDNDSLTYHPIATRYDPEQAAITKEINETIMNALSEMNDRESTIIILNYMQNIPDNETAEDIKNELGVEYTVSMIRSKREQIFSKSILRTKLSEKYLKESKSAKKSIDEIFASSYQGEPSYTDNDILNNVNIED